MQQELVSAQFAFVISSGDLQDTGHATGGIDARLHGCGNGLFADAVYYYLKDAGYVLGQSAYPSSRSDAQKAVLVEAFRNLYLDPTLESLANCP
jgi:hypothetical protein